MQIEERVVGDVTILDLKGKMTLGEGDELLKDKINSLVEPGSQEAAAQPRGCPVYRFGGSGRSRAGLHHRQPAGRQAEAPEPDQAHRGSPDHHEAHHGLRGATTPRKRRSRASPEERAAMPAR